MIKNKNCKMKMIKLSNKKKKNSVSLICKLIKFSLKCKPIN